MTHDMSFFISPFHMFSILILKCLNSHIQSIGSISQDSNHKIQQFITHTSVKHQNIISILIKNPFTVNHLDKLHYLRIVFGQRLVETPNHLLDSRQSLVLKYKIFSDQWPVSHSTSSKMIEIISEIKKPYQKIQNDDFSTSSSYHNSTI